MSTKAVHEKGTDKVTLSQKINDFLVNNRVILISLLAIFVVALIGLVTVSIVTDYKNKAAYATVEQVTADWDKARSATDKTGLATAEDGFIVSLQKVASSNRHSYAGGRADMTIAEIYFSRKDWKNAQEQFLAAAKAAPDAYICGLNYYNAAACADELGNADDAVTYFNKALSLDNFNLKPRAMFNIGRIEEQRSNKEAAIASYEKMAEQFPDDEWTLLAKSRIIALQIK